MIIVSPGETAFSVFGFSVFWYGIILAVAILCGVFCAEFLGKKYSAIPSGFFIDNSPAVIVAGIIGARLYYCLVNFSYYAAKPLEIFDIRQGGLSIHGMIIAGIITVFFLAEKYKIHVFELLDVLACSVALSQSIGRWGNFFNSEAFGLPTNSGWGLFIPVSHRPVEYLNYDLFHPAFLYESLADFIIFLILLLIFKKFKRGYVFFAYLILYSVARFAVESIRIDSVLYISGMPVAKFVSIITIIAAFVGLGFLIYHDYNSN